MMIVAQSKGDIDAWALHDQASMEEASLRGAEIFQIDKGTKTILFDGEKWVKDKPDFFQLRHKAFFASQEYVDERMRLLLSLMEKSIAPALAVILPSARKSIQREYDAFRDLIEEGNNGNLRNNS